MYILCTRANGKQTLSYLYVIGGGGGGCVGGAVVAHRSTKGKERYFFHMYACHLLVPYIVPERRMNKRYSI